ncbi:MAG TPA: TlpA disulfide reductase family protein, partial [Vicinamibacteria bacterium]|nr:TlpA disulfide reductase family protein [Vicinamibacteria bacterium]
MDRSRHLLFSTALVWCCLLGSARAQWYRAELITEHGERIPFFLQLPENCETATATIVNGQESIPTSCERDESGFTLDFPVYETRIEARFVENGDGAAVGTWSHFIPTVGKGSTKFEARPVAEPDPRTRFAIGSDEAREPPVDVSGIWRFEFDLYDLAKGVFHQEFTSVVTGTIEVPSEYGDMRFLAGNVFGRRMVLSTFDGRHAFLLEGRVGPDGTMHGEWVLDSRYWDPFVAERADDVELPDPLERVRVTSTETRLELEHLRSPKYVGKPVIVEIFGTWCPNCNDLAPVLVELHRKHRSEGLEIVGLAFEFEGDETANERRVLRFQEKHGAEWDIVIAEQSFEELVRDGLGGLTPIEGVPVTVFINRDGTIHAVYAGFSGPATGDA